MTSVSDAEFALFIHPHKNRYFAEASIGAAPGDISYRADHTPIDFINALPLAIYAEHVLPKLIAAAKLGIRDDQETVCIFLYEAIKELDAAKKIKLLEQLDTDRNEINLLILTQIMLHSTAKSRRYIFQNNPALSAVFILWALVEDRWDPRELAPLSAQTREKIFKSIDEPRLTDRIRKILRSVN
jgi:hypothetical protein